MLSRKLITPLNYGCEEKKKKLLYLLSSSVSRL